MRGSGRAPAPPARVAGNCPQSRIEQRRRSLPRATRVILCENGSRGKVFRDYSLWHLNTAGKPFSTEEAANGEMEMKAQETKLQDVENDLKQLMADVTRAMEKAQEAVARIASKAAPVITETESISR